LVSPDTDTLGGEKGVWGGGLNNAATQFIKEKQRIERE
jgi:hypothetical protein